MNIIWKVCMVGATGTWLKITVSILLRWCIALGSHSGEGKPPMHGDFEAQRHWQEITFNLNVKDWYRNSTDNDLNYWGLDYPPLTAYHSWLCAVVAHFFNPEWVELHKSRGIEDYHHKLFMRYTVLIADLVVFYVALMLLYYHDQSNRKHPTHLRIMLTLFYPGLLLIDHGHFQYNNVSLGFVILSVLAFQSDRDILGSIAFCAALNYKQMELFHALPVFFFLLGKVFRLNKLNGFLLLVKLGFTVVFSFVVFWAPFLSNFDVTVQVFQRLFPVTRGLFEDKVANVWCALSPFIKFKQLISQPTMLKLCAATTLISSLPSCIDLFHNPNIKQLKYSMLNVSLTFFLFSYQVHEKSILIPALSACLLYDTAPPILVTWFLQITVVSMSPLLFKDGLLLQTVTLYAMFLFITLLTHGANFEEFAHNISKPAQLFTTLPPKFTNYIARATRFLFWSSIAIGGVLIILPAIITPPPSLPDIIPVVTSTICCGLFLLFSLLFHLLQFNSLYEKVSLVAKTK